MQYSRAIKGAAIGATANAIANYITFNSLQPVNIVIGLVVGAIMGVLLK